MNTPPPEAPPLPPVPEGYDIWHIRGYGFKKKNCIFAYTYKFRDGWVEWEMSKDDDAIGDECPELFYIEAVKSTPAKQARIQGEPQKVTQDELCKILDGAAEKASAGAGETPRTDAVDKAVSEKFNSCKSQKDITDAYEDAWYELRLIARTLERELAAAEAKLVPCSLAEAARRPAKSISAIHQYDADACCRMLEKLRADTTDTARLDWLLAHSDFDICRMGRHEPEQFLNTRAEIDAAMKGGEEK